MPGTVTSQSVYGVLYTVAHNYHRVNECCCPNFYLLVALARCKVYGLPLQIVYTLSSNLQSLHWAFINYTMHGQYRFIVSVADQIFFFFLIIVYHIKNNKSIVLYYIYWILRFAHKIYNLLYIFTIQDIVDFRLVYVI